MEEEKEAFNFRLLAIRFGGVQRYPAACAKTMKLGRTLPARARLQKHTPITTTQKIWGSAHPPLPPPRSKHAVTRLIRRKPSN